VNKVEHKDVRKKLKEYAEGKIKDELLKKEMEEHIDGCYICKKELSLWQDVIEKQKAVNEMSKNIPVTDFRSRVSGRMASVNRDPNLPPAVRQLRQMSSFLSRYAAGALMLRTLISLIFVFLIVMALVKGKIIAFCLLVVSFFAFFWLSLQKKK
jgi:hypothetical protein